MSFAASASFRRPSIVAPSGLRAAYAAPHPLAGLARSQLQRTRQRSFSRAAAAAAASADSGKSVPPSSGLQAASCPLHACLLRYGITDLSAHSKPHHLALSQEAVDADVEPKLAALQAEGISPVQLLKLLTVANHPLLPCSYQDTFAPNLELLRRIAAHKEFEPHPQAPQLTAVGNWLLTIGAAQAAFYLTRSPDLVAATLQWLKGNLRVGLAELAGCKNPIEALNTPEAAIQAVASLLLERHVPLDTVAEVFLRGPLMFGFDPELLAAKMDFLSLELQVGSITALGLVLQQPSVPQKKLDVRLPPLLKFLDDYMGEEGAGQQLIIRSASLGGITAEAAQRGVSSLAALGYDQQQIRDIISKHPSLLTYELDSALQQQKLEWIATVSPWTLDDFLVHPRYFASSTRRLAGRLAWMREQGLQPPDSPASLAQWTDARFMGRMGRQLEPPQQLGLSDWKAWEKRWRQTEEGRRWGWPPLKH